jgi:hypothetical protein
MLKVRDGRIRRILARGSTSVKVASTWSAAAVARVPVEEHMANYRAARALVGKEKKAKPKK